MLSNQGGPAWPARRLVRLGYRSGRCIACPASTTAGWSSRRASTRTNSGRSRLAITCPVGRCTEPPLHCLPSEGGRLPSEGGRVVRIPLIPNRVRPGLCHGQVAYDDLGGAQRPLQQRAGIIKVEYAQVVREPQHVERARTTRQEGRLEHRGLPPGEVPERLTHSDPLPCAAPLVRRC